MKHLVDSLDANVVGCRRYQSHNRKHRWAVHFEDEVLGLEQSARTADS